MTTIVVGRGGSLDNGSKLVVAGKYDTEKYLP